MDASASILLIEDELLLCWSLEEALKPFGYTVVISTTGNAGLTAIEGSFPYDAIVTNIRLADGPDGWTLARRARQLHPQVAVIYVSGDSAADHAEQGVPGSVMLSKPFYPQQVQATLKRLLQPACLQ